jgi:hypothetical protein
VKTFSRHVAASLALALFLGTSPALAQTPRARVEHGWIQWLAAEIGQLFDLIVLTGPDEGPSEVPGPKG